MVTKTACVGCRLPAPEADNVMIQQVDKRVAAAIRFNGKPTLEVVEEKKKILEQALRKDGLKMKGTFGLARYNDPGRTWPVFMVKLLHKLSSTSSFSTSILFQLLEILFILHEFCFVY